MSRDGGPQQIRGTGGRSQGDDEHARERIAEMPDRARAGGDAGFSAAGARPPGPMKLQGTSGAGYTVPGVLALVGGDEFNPGNEEQDRILSAAARPGPAFVVPTAAARQGPEVAVAHARKWFKQFGLEVQELPVLKRRDAESTDLAKLARGGGFFYLVGGDPGLVAQVLRGSAVWGAIFQAWREGACLAGSSAGAMALCSHTLVRASWPNRFNRRAIEALGLLPNTAVLPHFDTFGHRWVESAQAAAPGLTLLGVDERSAALRIKDEWRALGPGSVTVIKGSKMARFASSSKVTGLHAPVRMLPPGD